MIKSLPEVKEGWIPRKNITSTADIFAFYREEEAGKYYFFTSKLQVVTDL